MNEELICLANLRLYSDRICADSSFCPLCVQGVGFGNRGGCGNGFAVALRGLVPAAKGVAITLCGGQSTVGLALFNLDSGGSSALSTVQIKGNVIHNGIGSLAAFFTFACSSKVCNEV